MDKAKWLAYNYQYKDGTYLNDYTKGLFMVKLLVKLIVLL